MLILTRGNEDDVDAEDGVREPGVEAVEDGHLQGGVEHSSGEETHGGLENAKGQSTQRDGGWAVGSPDSLLHRLANDVRGGSWLGERRQADHPLDGLVVFTTGAQQVEEGGEKNHLGKPEVTSSFVLFFHCYRPGNQQEAMRFG